MDLKIKKETLITVGWFAMIALAIIIVGCVGIGFMFGTEYLESDTIVCKGTGYTYDGYYRISDIDAMYHNFTKIDNDLFVCEADLDFYINLVEECDNCITNITGREDTLIYCNEDNLALDIKVGDSEEIIVLNDKLDSCKNGFEFYRNLTDKFSGNLKELDSNLTTCEFNLKLYRNLVEDCDDCDIAVNETTTNHAPEFRVGENPYGK